MIIVVFGWALFYFTDFTKLKEFFICAFGGTGIYIDYAAKSTFLSNIWLIIVLALASTPIFKIIYKKLVCIKCLRVVLPVVLVASSLILCFALLVGQSYNAFLYFRF